MAYVRTRLGRWYYEERGASRKAGDPAIVLGHSFLCDGGMWRAQIPALAALGRVINLDGPGHGKSEVPPPFSLEDHAEAMMDVFTELGVGDAVLVGLSWGGMVGMRVALAHPHRVAGLVLADTSARRPTRAERIKNRALLRFGRTFGLPRFLVETQAAPAMFGPKTIRERPDLVASFARTANGFDRVGVTRAGRAIMTHRTDISRRIGDIRAPTLVVCGRDDAACRPEESELIASRIPGARLEWIEDSGHLSAIESPEIVTRQITNFVKTLS